MHGVRLRRRHPGRCILSSGKSNDNANALAVIRSERHVRWEMAKVVRTPEGSSGVRCFLWAGFVRRSGPVKKDLKMNTAAQETRPRTLLEIAGATMTPARLRNAAIVVIDAQQEYVDGALALPAILRSMRSERCSPGCARQNADHPHRAPGTAGRSVRSGLAGGRDRLTSYPGPGRSRRCQTPAQ